ncbi:MAG: gamma-glutamyl-gamma-aminobutyrate hydrolase family protein [Tractidigestivibacter sp.]|uniref:gamma-glutamyl-gamma-aminobutyrate hydrolase family protein n=1 Tax=Tractidigestivibacter sp. TaxID=2847320 RepID=UPI003D8DC1FC
MSFSHSTKKPLIGITARWNSVKSPFIGEGEFDCDVCDDDFVCAVEAAGGIPVIIPIMGGEGLQDLVDSYLDLVDGIAMPGGPDVQPRLFGGDENYDPKLTCPKRDEFEMPVIRGAIERDKPLLAICKSEQMLNVVRGGTLNMDVFSRQSPEGVVTWNHEGGLARPVHPVRVVEGSLLSRCVDGANELQVNSAHHCIIDKVGDGLMVSARSTDGVIEAIELPACKFCLGVQWHPEHEWRVVHTDRMLWDSFVDACKK